MPLTQNWIGYLSRSYEQIKKSLLKRLVTLTPEITDHTENNLLIIIIEMFAGVAEMLGLYIDRIYRESFIGTALKLASVINRALELGYQIKAKTPASVNLLFSIVDSTEHLSTIAGDTIIPANTIITGQNFLTYLTVGEVKILSGYSYASGKAIQAVDVDFELIGQSDATSNQKFELPEDYANGSLKVRIDSEMWTSYTSFGFMLANTKGFVVNAQPDGKMYLQFGDGSAGFIPQDNIPIYVSYRTTDGSLGNTSPNTIAQFRDPILLVSGKKVIVTNPDYANGGRDLETVEEIKNRAPRALRTNYRTVTYQDYLDDPLLIPGVASDGVRYCCGKYIDVFIAPTGRGSASNLLISQVQDFLNGRKMIGTFPLVQAAGVSKIWIKGKVYAKPFSDLILTQLQVADALDRAYGYAIAKINPRIVISEIIALIENLSLVDRFELEQVKIQPFARAIDTTINPLDISWLSLPVGTLKAVYHVNWNGTTMDVLRNGEYISTIPIGGTFTNDTVSFTINDSSYTTNDHWEFITFPSFPEIFPTTVIQIRDYSATVFDVEDFVDNVHIRPWFSDITIIAQSILNEEQPTCD